MCFRSSSGFARQRGSVLVFLPGLFEINRLEALLEEIETQHQ